jgi:hypothetical protein
LAILTGALILDQEASINHIVQYKNPPPAIVAQPVVHKLENIGRWILPSKDLGAVCNILKALLEQGSIACVNPENPRCWRSGFGLIRVFDGKL